MSPTSYPLCGLLRWRTSRAGTPARIGCYNPERRKAMSRRISLAPRGTRRSFGHIIKWTVIGFGQRQHRWEHKSRTQILHLPLQRRPQASCYHFRSTRPILRDASIHHTGKHFRSSKHIATKTRLHPGRRPHQSHRNFWLSACLASCRVTRAAASNHRPVNPAAT
ncbi:hypothetical protein LZ31DRAFT_156964 [Colletotrichum somersetense]|nr:hypothetical protein LZ31DRAFT_156964 [Colletotrichum somersetense]